MLVEEFAAKRLDRLKAADDELRELVRAALEGWDGKGEFQSAALEEAVEVIWLEHFAAEAPRADYERYLPRFRQILTESLSKTSAPDREGLTDAQLERVTTFLGTLAVNDGTMRGAGARGVRFKRWTTMHDSSVRDAHTEADGQTRPILEPFTIEGVDLLYPGQPVGDPSLWMRCRCMVQPAAVRGDANVSDTTMTLSDDFDSRSQSLTAAAEEEHTGVGVFLVPVSDDPIVAASSEPAHLTTVWLGEMGDLDDETRQALITEVWTYADTLDGPVVVPAAERGLLGDEDADVQFLEKTDALVALRDGLISGSPTVEKVMNSVEQYPDWTPHVTLGYPETPAAGEYDGDAVTFDRMGLWIGPDHYEFAMGGDMAGKELAEAREKLAALVAAGEVEGEIDPEVERELLEGAEDGEMPADEPEEGEELVTEIPVHGVATLEGKATGDGRGFRPGAIKLGAMPQPLGYEYVSTHGGDTSHVAIVGRIDTYETVPSPTEGEGVFEVRWTGVVMPGKEYGARAIESILDGSYTGLSVIVDSVTVDVEEEREEMRQRILADRESAKRTGTDEIPATITDEEYDIEALIDTFVGDGTQSTTWFSDARVRRFDMVPTGAFQEGYVALGHEFADEMTPEQIEASAAALADCGCADSIEEANAIVAAAVAEFAPGTKDGPGWITHPIPTSRIRKYWVSGEGAAKIRWGVPGDFNRCRTQLAKYVQNPDWLAGLCANMHKEALGVWPGQEGGRHGHSLVASADVTPGKLFAIVASAAPIDAALFKRRELANPRVGVVVDGDAVYGYIAQWNVCHVGIADSCTMAPQSPSNYGQFRTGTVSTTEGLVAVGQITMNTGHAGGSLSARATVAHYDNTGSAVADIATGEDGFGIWFAGRIRPHVPEEDRYALQASGRLSGDWRTIGGQYELVAALCVNVPGFPIPEVSITASAEIGMGSIVAAGVIRPEDIDVPLTAEVQVLEGMNALSADDIAGIALASVERYFDMQQRQVIIEEVTPARDALARYNLAMAREELALYTEV